MVKTILSSSHSNSEAGTTAAGATEFWLFGYASFEKNATESTREIIYRAPGTLSKLYVRVNTNSTSASSTVTIRKNAADTALSVTIGAAATGEFEDADSVTVAAGDKLCIKTVSGGTGTFTMTIVSCIWDATTNCSVRYVAKGYTITSTTLNFLPIVGDRSGTTGTEANVENTIKTAGTVKNAAIFVSSNARPNNTPFVVRKNRADTAIVVTFGNIETGHKEDTTNSVSYAVDDELNWGFDPGTGTAALVAQSFAVDYETTTNGVLTRGCVGTTADVIVNSSSTWYFPIGGGNAENVTTESNVQMKAREAFTFKNLVAYTNLNSITASSTINFRVNGANSALTLTIAGSATGFFANTTDSVTVAAGDLIDFQIVTGATGTNMSLRQLGITSELVTTVPKPHTIWVEWEES